MTDLDNRSAKTELASLTSQIVASYVGRNSLPLGDLPGLIHTRAMAFLRRRGFVIPEDIKELAPDVLRHRLILSYEAEAEGVTTEDIIGQLLDRLPVP